MDIGKIKPISITSELSKAYVDYAMSVIVSRALPDIRDGLKPVHRRILYAMHSMSLGPGSSYSKSAKVVGEVVPRLAKIIDEGNSEKKTVSKVSVDAKDGLFMILDHTQGEARKQAEDALIKWCVGDYNSRAMAGQCTRS